MIERFIEEIPAELLDESGSVFYSGRTAFGGASPLYLLGLNPGGSPVRQASETVRWHTSKVLNEMPPEWSAYRDESWLGSVPGTRGLQPRVLHLLGSLGLDARRIPSSNVVFLRSEREQTLGRAFGALAERSWAFHRRVLDELQVRVILCFGRRAGDWVAQRIGANRTVGTFIEANERRWSSTARISRSGTVVVVATHPSIADWTTPAADPTPLVRQALDRGFS